MFIMQYLYVDTLLDGLFVGHHLKASLTVQHSNRHEYTPMTLGQRFMLVLWSAVR